MIISALRHDYDDNREILHPLQASCLHLMTVAGRLNQLSIMWKEIAEQQFPTIQGPLNCAWLWLRTQQ